MHATKKEPIIDTIVSVIGSLLYKYKNIPTAVSVADSAVGIFVFALFK